MARTVKKINIDVANPDLSVLREVIRKRLREQPDWKQLYIEGFYSYVELSPSRANDRQEFEHVMITLMWELVINGLIAPGNGSSQPNFPWFRVTPYGRGVLEHEEYQPFDRAGYIGLLRRQVTNPDATVVAYLDESLETFHRGNNVASMVMLGVAAERVFNILCDSLAAALASSKEAAKFRTALVRYQMKPKVDWVHQKFQALQSARTVGFPENATLMVTAIYDLIRSQRNDLGHPRDLPPRMSPGEAHANLLIFPRYYEAAENTRMFLSANKV